jgi:hypothetical protein
LVRGTCGAGILTCFPFAREGPYGRAREGPAKAPLLRFSPGAQDRLTLELMQLSRKLTPHLTSSSELAGLLHPAIDPGVRHVSGHRLPHTAEAVRGVLGTFPATHTPRRTSTRLQPYRVTAAVASLPFPLPLAAPSQGLRTEPDIPDWRARTRSEVDVAAASGDHQGRSTSRLCSVDESVTSSVPLLVPGRPVLHGLLVPSKVPLAARTRWNAPV